MSMTHVMSLVCGAVPIILIIYCINNKKDTDKQSKFKNLVVLTKELTQTHGSRHFKDDACFERMKEEFFQQNGLVESWE